MTAERLSKVSRRRFLATAFVGCLPGATALAGLAPAERFPASMRLTPGGPRLPRRGCGRFRFFFVGYYDCARYAAAKLSDAQALSAADTPRRFVIHALRDTSAFEFLWGLDQGLADNSTPEALLAVEHDLERIRAIVRRVGGLAFGMRGTIDYLPGRGVRLLLNGRRQGPALGGKPLADALFKVWLGEQPLDPTLKEDLFAG